MPLDYRKWDHIEVSDDEDDTHPNIDTPSLFKWRHEARVKREEEPLAEPEPEARVKRQEVGRRISRILEYCNAIGG